MTNRSRKNATYHINKDKRVITCVLHNCTDDFNDFEHSVHDKRERRLVVAYLYAGFAMKKGYVGIARCAPEDEWDEEKGKLLAFHRAKRAYDVDFFRCAQNFVDDLDRCMDEYLQAINEVGARFTRNAGRRALELNENK